MHAQTQSAPRVAAPFDHQLSLSPEMSHTGKVDPSVANVALNTDDNYCGLTFGEIEAAARRAAFDTIECLLEDRTDPASIVALAAHRALDARRNAP